MKILELNIRHFGKFEDTRMRFKSGMNQICGGNESGKTTTCAFIKDMLFGINRERGGGRQTDEYALRQPWDNGAYFAGSIRFEQDGKIYRIERNFYQHDRSVKVICESEGRDSTRQYLDGEWLPGNVSEDIFRNTVFIPQTGAQTSASFAGQIRSYLVNRQESGDA